MQLSLSVDDEAVSISNSQFPLIHFNNFNGPLYIGGHPSLETLGVSILILIISRCIHVFIAQV